MIYLKVSEYIAISNFRATQNNSDFQFFLQMKHMISRLQEKVDSYLSNLHNAVQSNDSYHMEKGQENVTSTM